MPDKEGAEPKTMTIGASNVFEVGCGILNSILKSHPVLLINIGDIDLFLMKLVLSD